MIEKDWYKNWFASPYYHQLYQNRNEKEALQFIAKLIAFLQPNITSKMIDIACGKGRHSKALADMGYDVTGIDLSSPSIADAKQFEHKKLHFVTHDMRLPFRSNYFDVAFNLFTSFGYFETQQEHDDALHTMAACIKNNGIFVLDYLNINLHENEEKNIQIKQIEDTIFHITKWNDEHYFYKRIQIETNKNDTLQELFTERVAKFNLPLFTTMLQQQNLFIENVFGDYLLNAFNETTSPRLIIVARKKN